MKNNTHITLDDIARRLKVSKVTVSKALRGHPDISDATKQRVRKVAHELNYSPNMSARNLSARRSNMLGLVVPKIAHFFFGSIIEAVYNTAFENKYETILTVSQESAERERQQLETLVSMRVDGIMISVSRETRDTRVFEWIRKIGIPLVFLDRRPDPPPAGFSSVMVDDRRGAFQAVEQAIKVGYRKIGYVGGNLHINIGKCRFQGFQEALKKHGLQAKREWIIQNGFGRDDGYNGFMQMHKTGQLPEFVFAVTYPVAVGVYEAARQLGVRIPDDVDIISFGDSDVGRLIFPAMSCVVQPTGELGSKAVRMVLEAIMNPEGYHEQHLEIPTELVLRETCIGKTGADVRAREGTMNLLTGTNAQPAERKQA